VIGGIRRPILALSVLVVVPTGAGASPIPPLVAGCYGCHAVHGGDQALPPLAGRSSSQIVAEMKAFRTGAQPATVMGRIAKGFTPDEIAAIAAWYTSQR
jgi:cytochrome subunit of sulfide dehydrogenase